MPETQRVGKAEYLTSSRGDRTFQKKIPSMAEVNLMESRREKTINLRLKKINNVSKTTLHTHVF